MPSNNRLGAHMTLLRRWLLRLHLAALTPDDLAALLDRSGDKSKSWRTRFLALVEYALLTQSDDRLRVLIQVFRSDILARRENNASFTK